MFDKIEFNRKSSKKPLCSSHITEKDLNNPEYSRESLLNSYFSISGSVESFSVPPISDCALQNMFYLETFNIFHYALNSFIEREHINSYMILYTYSGNGSLTYHNHTYLLSEGDGLLINCNDYHLGKACSDPWSVALIQINGSLMPSFYEQYEKNPTVLFHDSITGQFQDYLEQLLYLYSYPPLYRDWHVFSCINNLLCHILKLVAKTDSKKSQVSDDFVYLLRYMEHNYTNPLSLDDLANFANIDKYYLSREFKKYTGFSPNDYLISLRINQAKIKLKSTALPASKIAHEVGIYDINNFYNLFKKKTGMTPIEYRNSSQL